MQRELNNTQDLFSQKELRVVFICIIEGKGTTRKATESELQLIDKTMDFSSLEKGCVVPGINAKFESYGKEMNTVYLHEV